MPAVPARSTASRWAVLRAAEAAHHGRAADAANASIAEIKPFAEAAANTSRGVKAALEEQATYQREAFQSLPRQGEKLPSGQEAVLDPPQKGWVEDWGLDSNPITGWMSDYEDRQQAYVDTNQQANAAMERYSRGRHRADAGVPARRPAAASTTAGPAAVYTDPERVFVEPQHPQQPHQRTVHFGHSLRHLVVVGDAARPFLRSAVVSAVHAASEHRSVVGDAAARSALHPAARRGARPGRHAVPAESADRRMGAAEPL
ncbi:hypothetical protein [Saccharopolyspora pogona]|uniref:hypothetical protein n=1 Tax=Saccharopolyspora pogona TaxID=333966 RepID=UPI0016887BCF|nr:hypothetical protein [Saccharopolyspora pogona]